MSVEYKDYYKTLEVSRTASKEDISKAYKKLARKYHPDLNDGDPKAEERFKEVNEAHEVLKDPEKRRMYDQLGPNWKNGQNFGGGQGFSNMNFGGGQGFGGSGFSDFFETIFGGFGASGQGGFSGGFGQHGGFTGGQGFSNFSRPPQKGSDVEVSLPLSLEDAYNGGEKSINVGNKALKVTIPAGVKNGAKIRLSGQGQAGAGGAGDMFLKISLLPHAKFKVEDTDVTLELNLTPWEAALGEKVRIPTLSGEVEMTVKPGTSSGKKMRIRGKGLGAGKNKGDQIIRINVLVPETLTDEEKSLFEQLRSVSKFTAR